MRPKKTFPVEVRSILAHLREVFRRSRGSMTRVVRELGLNRSYFTQRWSRPPATFDAGLLVAALRSLGIDAAHFFREIYPAAAGGEIWEGPEPVEERTTNATRRAVGLASRRMRDELGLDVDAGDVAEGETTVSGEPGPPLGAEWLEDLDGRRQTEPEAVIAELAAHLHRVEPALLPRALGIWGSALRTMIELEAAAYVNRRALRLARAAGDDATVADLLQRRAHIMGDGGDYGRALAIADLAVGIFDRIGDRTGRGRATVDQGRWLYYLGRFREVIEVNRRALDLLPQSLPRSRFAAHVGTALCYLQLEDFTNAHRAAEAATPSGPWDRGKLVWLRGSLSWKAGDLDEAERHLSEAGGIFQQLHYGLAALAVLELAEVQLAQGKAEEAWQTCRTIYPLVRPLERIPVIAGALVELLQIKKRRLPLDLVRRVRREIERQRERTDTRARRAWRALAAKPL